MECSNCGKTVRINGVKCPYCDSVLTGGVVFITGIGGSGVREYLDQVIKVAEAHGHSVERHDIGLIMRKHADENNLDIQWARILDTDERALRLLRAMAINEVADQFSRNPDSCHVVDLHLSFRWRAYLTKGFEPHILEPFKSRVRMFINVVEDLARVQERLAQTAWGRREILELLIWRDEELLLTDMFADMCNLERSYALAAGEPPAEAEKLIWHPEFKKVYLSFPITALLDDPGAGEQIVAFRDRIREFLVVFDPYACKDYGETYVRPEMAALRREVGDVTEERDYRFIDQADGVVVYFPRDVPSKGVEAELNYARRTGKPIYMYAPAGGRAHGPFSVPPRHLKNDTEEFIELLRAELAPELVG